SSMYISTVHRLAVPIVITSRSHAQVAVAVAGPSRSRHTPRVRAVVAGACQLAVVELKVEPVHHVHHAGHRLGEFHRQLGGGATVGAAGQGHDTVAYRHLDLA